jgi:type III secretion protein R
VKRAAARLSMVLGAALVPHVALAASGKADALASRPLVLVFAMAALSLLPFALLMLTCFVRVSVVLSIVRSAIGAAQVPPSTVLTGLAMILTLYVMAPTGERIYQAVQPVLDTGSGADVFRGGTVTALQAAGDRAKEPLRDFLIKHGDGRDRAMFADLARRLRAPAERAAITDRDLLVVAPAFVVSELRRAFEIGFLLFIPFLIIDLVIANLLLALGMHMLSPPTVALPFKLLLFVMADGWHLIVRGLIEGYL